MNDSFFLGIMNLLRIGTRTGVLATAIEQHGLFGWDRYGRLQKFDKDTPEAIQVLDELAWLHRGYLSDPSKLNELIETLDEREVLADFGWPDDRAPDFRSIAASEPETPKRTVSSIKSENATLRIVDSLLLFIEGKLGTDKHPEYKSQAQLIDFLVDKMQGYSGMSKRNLEAKFAAARALNN